MAAHFGPPRESPWRASDAMGAWLETFQWDAFATFTFDPTRWGPTGPSGDRCLHHTRLFVERLTPTVPIGFFVAVEQGKRGRVHSHALLNLDAHGLKRSAVWRAWFRRYGRASIRPVSEAPEERAHYYVAKYLVKAPLLWDIGGTILPR